MKNWYVVYNYKEGKASRPSIGAGVVSLDADEFLIGETSLALAQHLKLSNLVLINWSEISDSQYTEYQKIVGTGGKDIQRGSITEEIRDGNN